MVFDPLATYLSSDKYRGTSSGENIKKMHFSEDKCDGSDEDELLDVESTTLTNMTPLNGVNYKELSSQLSILKSYVLEPLYRHPKSVVFRKPVDHVALGIPDYPKIITIPMDLGTIRKNLRNRKYTSLQDCIHHIDLVWKNAKKFNPPDHFVHKIACELEEFAKNQLAKIDFVKCKLYGNNNGHLNNSSLNGSNRRQRTSLSSRKTPMTYSGTFTPKDPMIACQEIIDELLTLDIHRFYVDPFRERSGLNLNRIQSWLRKSIYVHPTQVADDIRALISGVYRRASQYNSREMNLASQLQHKFEVMYARRVFFESSSKERDLGDSSVYTKQLLLAQNSLLAIQSDLQSLFTGFYLDKQKNKNKKKTIKAASFPNSKKRKISNSWSREQIIELQKRIGQLNEQHQTPILSLMHQNGEKITEDEDGYVVLDIEEASLESLNDIKNYIDSLPVEKNGIGSTDNSSSSNESSVSSSDSSDEE